jgi:hypothetical protein
MKINIILGQNIRKDKLITVDVPDDFNSWPEEKKDEVMSKIYDVDDGEGFEVDEDNDLEESYHFPLDELISEDMELDFKVDANGVVMNVDGEVL